MAETGKFDVVVIGSGPGGYVAAIRAAQLGLSTAIVEKDAALGGTCLNIGCIPSKALLDSSELYAEARAGMAAHGIRAENVALDLPGMMARKRRIVGTFTGGVGLLMRENHVAVFHGAARLSSPVRVEVSAADGTAVSLRTRSVILAAGSIPAGLTFLPFDGKRIVSSTEALDFAEVPKRLLVVGAGAIGLELGSVWNRLGSSVTVIELLPQILPGWDAQISKTLLRSLTRQGMVFHVSTAVSSFSQGADGLTLAAKDQSGSETRFEGDVVLVAVGRKPCSDGLGLEEIGVKRDRAGRVVVDGRLWTGVESVYAIGDLVAGPMLAHKAEEEGIAAAETIAGKAGHVDYGTIPSVVYTSPEAASVGMTEDALRAENRRYTAGSFLFKNNGRALALEKPDGFVKVLADPDTDRILGVHIVGAFASDLISEAVTVMAFGGSAEDIARTAHAHPSLSEAIREAALAAGNRPLNQPPLRVGGPDSGRTAARTT